MRVCLCACVCLPVFLSVSVYMYDCVCLHVCLCLYICMSIVCVCIYVCLTSVSVYMYVCVCIYVCLCLCICMYVCPSVYLHISINQYLSKACGVPRSEIQLHRFVVSPSCGMSSLKKINMTMHNKYQSR